VNFILMAIFSALLFLTLPTNGVGGNFIAFFGVFLMLFLTAGLGSGSTFQMISVNFRKMTLERVKTLAAVKPRRCVRRQPKPLLRWALFQLLGRLAASLSRKPSVPRWRSPVPRRAR
jgi:NNP family nitrate/nitrite transporter-like MFS transporter